MKERLNEWWKKNEPAENLIYRDGLREQCNFIINTMHDLFFYIATDYNEGMSLDEWSAIDIEFKPYVVGTHRSKSVLLPVMEMDLSKLGVKIVLRYNFYDWCISVESENDIECDFMGLITDDKGYFEGFPSDRIYDGYSENNKRNFSLCLRDKYQVYTFLYILRYFLTK